MVKKTDTRSALIEATIDIIEVDGESGFRISAVLDRVGVASTAIYHHFGSRDDLLDSANAERYLRTLFVPDFDNFVAAVRTFTCVEEFDELMHQMFAAGRLPSALPRRRTRIAVLGSAVSRPSLAQKISEANATYANAMAKAFEPARDRGWIRSDLDLQALAMWIIGESTGRFMIEIGPPFVDAEEWARAETDALIAAIKGA